MLGFCANLWDLLCVFHAALVTGAPVTLYHLSSVNEHIFVCKLTEFVEDIVLCLSEALTKQKDTTRLWTFFNCIGAGTYFNGCALVSVSLPALGFSPNMLIITRISADLYNVQLFSHARTTCVIGI